MAFLWGAFYDLYFEDRTNRDGAQNLNGRSCAANLTYRLAGEPQRALGRVLMAIAGPGKGD
jgi:hypothetical protein